MSEGYCAALNVLILAMIAGLNGILIRRTSGLGEVTRRQSQRDSDENL